MQKIINDPVHGFITINDELIYQLISHPYFQRLRRIKQMALAYLVYPGAVHTRLHHALGAYHLMFKVMEELKLKKIPITPEEEQAAKIAILLHDIGHAPFSHALEHTLVNVHHEDISMLIMEKLNQEFQGQLSLAIEIFKGSYKKKFLHQLVSSQLDMDRLDYLARDSFFTGVSEGVIGYDRIIKMMTVVDDQIMIEEKGIHSVEKFLIARRLMYWQVYLHKTVMGSELMLTKILQRAKQKLQEKHDLFTTPSLRFFLENEYDLDDFKSNEDCLRHYVNLDDTDITTAIKFWSTHSDPILTTLCHHLLNRRLFKLKFYNEPDSDEKKAYLKQWLSKNNYSDEELAYYVVEGHVSNTTYDTTSGEIQIIYKNQRTHTIDQVDHALITHELQVPIKKHYICHLN